MIMIDVIDIFGGIAIISVSQKFIDCITSKILNKFKIFDNIYLLDQISIWGH